MTDILDAGVAVILWMEACRTPALTTFFELVTDLGSTPAYVMMVPILWWGVSWKLSARVFAALVLSVYLNALIKETVALPRPFVYAEVDNLRTPDDYSFPSGHAQQAALFWTLLALHARKTWFSAVAAGIVGLIGTSRVYLGVHFPSDVIVGWGIGLALALAFARWFEPIVAAVRRRAPAEQAGLALSVPGLLALAHPSESIAIAMGGLAGALAGLVAARRYGLYPELGASARRRSWLLVGLLGLPLLYFALEAITPTGLSATAHRVAIFLRFAAVGLWVSFVVPWIENAWHGARLR